MRNPLSRLGGRRRLAVLLSAGGVVLIGVGLGVLVPPLWGVIQRGQADQRALDAWNDPGAALAKHLPSVKTTTEPGVSPGVTAPSCGSGSPASAYALVQFPSLSGVEGVAGNGGWSLLLERSVVHYANSPGPGQPGNSVIALHREPNFEPLGTLRAGDPIVVTNRQCQKFTYKVTRTWTEYPSQVTQLDPVSSGSWLTVITCTPLWIDTQRLVIRAQLEGS